MISTCTDKTGHYESTKQYFRENLQEEQGYYEAEKTDIRQQKIFNLCFSLLDALFKDQNTVTTAVDIGCGMGYFSRELIKRYPQFHQIAGIDFLQEIIIHAREQSVETTKIVYIIGDLLRIPFPDQRFDVTFCIDTLHHIHRDDLRTAIRELARITNKYLILEIRNRKNLFHFYFTNILEPIKFRRLPICTTSIEEISDIIKEYGFTLEIARRIAHSKWNCRRLVLVYRRVDDVKTLMRSRD